MAVAKENGRDIDKPKNLAKSVTVEQQEGAVQMNFSAVIAFLVCKISHGILQIFRRGGTALPGKLALRICPNVLYIAASKFKVVAITGTNGKTTSSRMIETEFHHAGYSAFSNRSGANLSSGITTAFILHTTIFGRPKNEWAIIECDEAASARVFAEIQPRIVLVTNLFRDQLDRYGEIFHTRDYILTGLKGAPNALVCLNADCPLTASMAEQISNRVRYYGIEKSAAVAKEHPSALSDAAHCLRCGAKYSYSYVTYAHLGGFFCPACGDRRKTTDVAVKKILSRTQESSRVLLRLGEKECAADIRLPTVYNIYNASGAAAVANAAGIETEAITRALSDFTGVFGRMEKFVLGQTDCTMILVKNPAAFNQALEHLCETDGNIVLVLGLNDYAADGRDVSWIWDVNMEQLCDIDRRIDRIIFFGSRYADMALRLKYAGLSEDKFVLVRGCDSRILSKLIRSAPSRVYILPTYTAMVKMRKALVKKHGAGFWR